MYVMMYREIWRQGETERGRWRNACVSGWRGLCIRVCSSFILKEKVKYQVIKELSCYFCIKALNVAKNEKILVLTRKEKEETGVKLRISFLFTGQLSLAECYNL